MVTPNQPPAHVRPARLVDAIRENTRPGPAQTSQTAAPAAVSVQPTPPVPTSTASAPVATPAAPAAPATGGNDVSALRSVKSEALKPATGQGRIGASARSADPDDLKRIRGIGVLIEKKLNALGIYAYDDIANWTAADIERISDALDFRGRIERENWIEQARILSSGGNTDFSRRRDRGEVS